MIRVEPTYTTNFQATKTNTQVQPDKKQVKGRTILLASSLAALAVLGITVIGKRKQTSYDEALKKAGIQIKDNVAFSTKTGQKYSGRIQCLTKDKRKQTVEFVDGKITERLNYNKSGKELDGTFYKDDKRVLQIWRTNCQNGKSKGFAYRYEGDFQSKPTPFVETEHGFDWARNFLKQTI